MNILLFGAAGMVGDGVLRRPIAAPELNRVVAVSRKALSVQYPKLETIIEGDMFHFSIKKRFNVSKPVSFASERPRWG